MSVSIFRNFICWVLLITFPLSLWAADTRPTAILHTKGGVWVNGSGAPDSTAVFPGDLLETRSGSVANLDSEGSSALIQAESLVTYNGDSLTLEHGSVTVATSRSMSVRVNCIRIVPVSTAWTQYQVTDVNGTVQVSAVKSDVNISQSLQSHKPSAESASQSATVHEGEQAERNESEACGMAEQPRAPTSGLNMKWVEIGGAAGGGAIILCVLLCKGSPPPNVSPWQP